MRTILLVDADPLSLRALAASLRQAGFTVTTARTPDRALEQLGEGVPDLVVTDAIPTDSGTAKMLLESIRQREGGADVPFIVLSGPGSAAMPVEDVIPKPVSSRELLARVQLLLARRAARWVSGAGPMAGPISGTTDELSLVDLLLGLEASRTTAVVHLENDDQRASVYVRDGNVVDAELGRLRGAEVVRRLLGWGAASFQVAPGHVDNEDICECTTQALLLRTLDRLEEPPLESPAQETASPVVDTSRERSVPSTAPWIREAAPSESARAEADLVAAGVPDARGRTIRRLGLGLAAAGALALLVARLGSTRSPQSPDAESGRSGNAVLGGLGGAAAPAVAAATPTEARVGPAAAAEGASTASMSTSSPTANGTISPTGDVNVAPSELPAPLSSAKDPRETALDVRAELHAKSPLVRDAQRALLKGDTAAAMSLAQRAVAANSGDADAWLTLAAARKAAGDLAGARDTYNKCVAMAHTFGVMSCRALAARGQ